MPFSWINTLFSFSKILGGAKTEVPFSDLQDAILFICPV